MSDNEHLLGGPTWEDVVKKDLQGKQSPSLKKWYFRKRYGRIFNSVSPEDMKVIREKMSALMAVGSMDGLTLWRNAKGHTIELHKFSFEDVWKIGYYGNYHASVPEAFAGYDRLCIVRCGSLEEAIGLLVR